MLKVLIFSSLMTVSLSILSHDNFYGKVYYDQEVILPCVIIFDEGYWSWRGSIPKATDLRGDINHIYNIFYKKYSDFMKKNNKKNFISDDVFLRSMCTADILFSEELTRVMNFFGSNSSPREFLIFMDEYLQDEYLSKGVYDISEEIFGKAVESTLLELESRFN